MATQSETNVVENEACCDNDTGFVQEEVGDTTERLRRKEVNRDRRIWGCTFGRGRRFSFLLRCHPVAEIQQLLQNRQQRRDEAHHGATEHEEVPAKVFEHKRVPFLGLVAILSTKGNPRQQKSRSQQSDPVFPIDLVCLVYLA